MTAAPIDEHPAVRPVRELSLPKTLLDIIIEGPINKTRRIGKYQGGVRHVYPGRSRRSSLIGLILAPLER